MTRVTAVVRDMAGEIIVRPLRDGRLRLDHLPISVRRAAAVGLMVLTAVTGSLLAVDALRRGSLLVVGTSSHPTLVPTVVFPLTLLCLFVAWVLIVFGATLASVPVRLAAAVGFLLVNVSLSRAPTIHVGRSWFLDHGATVAHAGYLAVPLALAVSAVLAIWPGIERRLRPVVVTIAVAGCAALFGSLLLVHLAAVNAGLPTVVPTSVDLAIAGIANVTLPLVIAGAAAVVDFGYSVTTALTLPARAWLERGRTIKGVVAGLVVVGAGWQVRNNWSQLSDLVRHRPLLLTRSGFALLLFGLFAVGYRRLPRGDDQAASDHITYASALLIALPPVVIVLRSLLGLFFTFDLKWPAAANALGGGRGDHGIQTWGGAIMWATVLALAVAVAVRARRRPSTTSTAVRTAAGFAVVATWALSASLFDAAGRNPGLSITVISTAISVGVAAIAVVLWPRLSTSAVVNLAALALFGWVVSLRGEIVATIGKALAAPDAVLLVFAVVYGVAAGCAYTRGDTHAFPRGARVLLFVGYLVAATTLLSWVHLTHELDFSAAIQSQGFIVLALPLAAWFAMSRRFEPTTSVEEAGGSVA